MVVGIYGGAEMKDKNDCCTGAVSWQIPGQLVRQLETILRQDHF